MTYHEKVAMAMSKTRVGQSAGDYETFLGLLLKKEPDETKLRAVVEKIESDARRLFDCQEYKFIKEDDD